MRGDKTSRARATTTWASSTSIKNLFDLFDKDKDGSVTLSEVQAILGVPDVEVAAAADPAAAAAAPGTPDTSGTAPERGETAPEIPPEVAEADKVASAKALAIAKGDAEEEPNIAREAPVAAVNEGK